MAEPDPDAPEVERQRLQLTPEQRRFLGGSRSLNPQAPAEPKTKSSETVAKPKSEASPPPQASEPSRPSEQRAPRRDRRSTISKALEMQTLAWVAGALVLVGATFYVGKKFEYWRYLLATRTEAKIAAKVTGEFAGASADELVEHAVMDEQLGHWDDAAKRLIAAKYKNPALGGVLFHAAKLYYDHSDFDSADRLFESAIGFGENVDAANYFRGMIASSRNDFPAAERSFEAASDAAPFNPDYYYSLAETLRKDHRPKDAIARYEQAARRSGDESAQAICRFKGRMAEIEAGDVDPVRSELEHKRKLGSLPIDWQMTEAAIAIQQGDTSQAVKLISEAREADRPELDAHFAACVGDRFFAVACQSNQDLAQACRVSP
jgi:tetratricopeptide (TPR) repeat protein